MEEIFLDVQLREERGKSASHGLRRQGYIPAVVYKDGEEAQALKVSHHDFVRMMHQHRVENVIIGLKINQDKKQRLRTCMIKELQYDPVHDDILHIDFQEISLTKAIKVNVPVVSKGESIGVKQEGGSLEHVLWEVEVECLPTQIPKNFEADVSNLKIGDSIHLKDIPVPGQVKVLTDPEAVAFMVVAPMKEEVPVEPVEGEEKQEPEVIKEKKEVPEEGAEEEAKEKDKDKDKDKDKK
jgi:large subunit ribosomal protein L25